MLSEQADKFFDGVEWFNSFFQDVKTLLDRITGQIEGYDNKLYYYAKRNDMPSIPRLYHALLGSEGKPDINISVVLGRELAAGPLFATREPTILVAVHTYGKWSYTAVTLALLEGRGISEVREQSGMVSGMVDVKDKQGIQFHAFTVPLDAFAEYSDEIVDDLIVSRVRHITEQLTGAVEQ